MSLRPPGNAPSQRFKTGLDTLDHEIAGEMASSLGRAGEEVERTLAALRACASDDAHRPQRVRAAAKAVYAFFIQRELIGLRRHQDAIRHFAIPDEVLRRLGAF